MDERYYRMVANKHSYIGVEVVMILGIAIVHLARNEILIITTRVVLVAFVAYFLYYEESIKPARRLLECEIFIGVISICERLGVDMADWLLKYLNIEIKTNIMKICIETSFSNIILAFLLFMAFGKLMKKKGIPYTTPQYVFICIISGYALFDIIAIADHLHNASYDYVLMHNVGCIVLVDLFSLYHIKVINEKRFLKNEVKLMEKQADLQYKYYVRQEQKYNKTLGLLHDVDKHMKAIEHLHLIGDTDIAAEYAKQIGSMLQPLMPIKHTGNPVLDILLADYRTIMDEKSISFDMKVDHANMDFVHPIDITTIFGNLLENAIEACENVENDRKIFLRIGTYHEMISIRMGNNCRAVKWKNGVPISQKGQNHGMGLLNVKRSVIKYDGNIKLKAEDGIFLVDIFLNR